MKFYGDLSKEEKVVVKSIDLKGDGLNYSVSRAIGNAPEPWLFKPSSDWEFAGPLLKQYKISIICKKGGWTAVMNLSKKMANIEITHRDPLVAAMRILVLSELGEEVQIPKSIK